ncbi:DNA mismatch repair protein MutS [Duganella sp. FT94W]|uniref:DNA mismatch repair protein MutS n=1 Tax=Duganella lactea TaxID=2692173 RepID=A0ABW9VEF5_9BURK|nr:DNA mismatch repair protein MutS [Duganella lactea]MYM36968.1 DNA mismatch repair protein MutS [Duganella lactea]
MTDYPFVASDVALYHRTVSGTDSVVDSHTWNDLLLPEYSARLARETSILGQQALHSRLHLARGGGEASVVRVRALAADAGLRTQLQAASKDLRDADREISETLFGAVLPSLSRWLPVLRWLPLMFVASIGAALLTGWMPLWGVAVVLALLLCGIQARYYEAVQEWGRILKTTQLMLRAHTLFGQIDAPAAEPLREDAAQAAKLNRRMSRSLLSNMPGAREYGDWFFLQNVRHFFQSREVVRESVSFLRSSFERVAALEADLALARHLVSVDAYCWAEQGEEVALDQVVHPLLDDAAALTFGMARQGVFISGQNGIGKSTLLRTVGLNLITARAFGFCYAARAVTPLLPVYSSMQNEDAMASGESFYMAELRRGQELLALAALRPAIFVIDEIFRGTNYLESVSAAGAVLHELSQRGRVMVASHHLVLASLLSDCLQPWCVSRVDGRWRLAPGLLVATNGIALLTERGFDSAVTQKANRIHAWLSNYMAGPAGFSGEQLDQQNDLQRQG